MKAKYLVILMLSGFIVALTLTNIHSTKIDKLYADYPAINLETSFCGKITELYIERGVIFAKLNRHKLQFEPSDNEQVTVRFATHIITIGDSIVKNNGSDTLYIFHDNKKYWYKLFLE